ncbi:MAG TPA: AAA family ATPase [Dehalococcoidia bacterium]|nr:AAA family ATPase [Dehalococcoidia bacterium]
MAASGEQRALIIAIANQKGGVGKTTTAINLGAELAARGVTCLLVDLDPQANATAGLGLSRGDGPTIYDVLIDDQPLDEVIIVTVQSGLDLAPAGPDLAGAEVELVPAMAREQRLRRALDAVSGRYEAIIVDCPPSLGLLTLNALNAADEVLVPVQCEYLALEGLGQLTGTLEAVRRNLNPRLHLGGLLLTMYDSRTNLSQEVADEVRRHFPATFQTVIPRSVRVSEAPSHGLPISLYAGSSPAAKAYAAFAGEVIATLLPGHADKQSANEKVRAKR